MSLALAACGDTKSSAKVLELNGSTMGTGYKITAIDYDGKIDKRDLEMAVEKSLLDVNAKLSNWDPSSEISRFNALNSTNPVQVSKSLAEVVRASREINSASDGQFDITLGPVIEAWGFGARNDSRSVAPDAQLLSSAMEAAGQTGNLKLEGTLLAKSKTNTELFLPSIGKGYGVDQLANVVRSFGMKDFMVDIGGDTYVSGQNTSGNKWQMAIETPNAMTRQAFKVASVSNLGMATSGDYRNYYEQGGQRYSHIIDAKTGRPVTHRTASVTVLAENTMMADGWATALLAAGTKRGMEMANDLKLAAMFIDRTSSNLDDGFKAYTSANFDALQA